MAEIKDGGPAFPVSDIQGLSPKNLDDMKRAAAGMSLRDYFAAHAPEPPPAWHGGSRDFDDVLDWRWYYADRMLKARQS